MEGCVKKNHNTEMVCVGKKGNGQVWVTYLNINPAEIYSGTRGISTSTLPDPW